VSFARIFCCRGVKPRTGTEDETREIGKGSAEAGVSVRNDDSSLRWARFSALFRAIWRLLIVG